MPWVNDPAGPVAAQIVPLYWIMFGFAVVVLAIVVGAIVYSGIRYRERPGHEARQFHGHNMLELTWTVIPTIMVIGFTLLSFQRLLIINDVSGEADMTIRVEGRQFTWVYSYPEEERFRLQDGSYLQGAQEIHIPVDTKVRLELTARDVIHSFWVPNVGGKKDAIPGRTTELWLEASRTGTFKGQCYELCGEGHADMLVTLVVQTPEEWEAWAEEAVAQADRLNDPETARGRELFLSLACAGCHTVEGTTAQGKVAPRDLTNVASFEDIAGVLSPVNEENLFRWIKDPQAEKPGTLMPTLGLDDETVRAIVQWLLTLE